MTFIQLLERFQKRWIDTLSPLLLDLSAPHSVAPHGVFMGQVNVSSDQPAVQVRKDDTVALGAAFLPDIHHFPWTEAGECLQPHGKSDVRGIPQRQVHQDLEHLRRNVPEDFLLLRYIPDLKIRNRSFYQPATVVIALCFTVQFIPLHGDIPSILPAQLYEEQRD